MYNNKSLEYKKQSDKNTQTSELTLSHKYGYKFEFKAKRKFCFFIKAKLLKRGNPRRTIYQMAVCVMRSCDKLTPTFIKKLMKAKNTNKLS